jgi:hypothetical protein
MSFFKHEDFKPAPSNRRCFLLFIWNIIRIVSFIFYALACVCELTSYLLPIKHLYIFGPVLNNPWVFLFSYLLLIQGFLYKTSRLDTSLGCAICTFLTLYLHYFSATFALETSVIPWVVFLLNNDIQVCKFFMALSIILSYFPFFVEGRLYLKLSNSFSAYITGLLVLAVVFKVRSCYLKNIMYSVCLALTWWYGIPLQNLDRWTDWGW